MYAQVIRWPSHLASCAEKFILKTKLHQSDTRALSLCENYFATGSIDGEVIIWDIHSNVTLRHFKCPKDMNGISELLLQRMDDQRLWAFVGTDDGIIHIFVQIETLNNKFICMHSITDAFTEPILAIRIFKGKHKRMIVSDCQKTMKIWDISKLNVETLSRQLLKEKLITHNDEYKPVFYLLLKTWRPHKGNTTCVLHINHYAVFATACDTGEIKLWNIDGQLIGKFGVSSWKLNDNNFSTNSNCLDEILHDNENTNIEHDSFKLKQRKTSYFDNVNIYTPRFIRSVVTEGFSSKLFSRHEHHTTKKSSQNKSTLELKLDRLIVCAIFCFHKRTFFDFVCISMMFILEYIYEEKHKQWKE